MKRFDITDGWFHSGCVLGENEKLTNPEKQCEPEIVYMINRAFKERIKIANYQSFGYFQVYATGEVGAKVLKDLEAFGGVNLGYNVAFDKAVRMSSYFPKFGIKGYGGVTYLDRYNFEVGYSNVSKFTMSAGIRYEF